MGEPELERRLNDAEEQIRDLRTRLLGRVSDDLHDVQSDVAVLKERSGNTDRQIAGVVDDLGELRTEVRGIRDSIQAVVDMLGGHLLQENKDRVRLLLGVLAGLAGIYAPRIFDILHP